MASASRIKRKVDKIINKANLGSTLTIYEYSQTTDRYGKRTKTLTDTIDTSGASVGTEPINTVLNDGTPFHTKVITLLIPTFEYDRTKYYEFLWFGDRYRISKEGLAEIGQIQDINIVYRFKLERIE